MHPTAVGPYRVIRKLGEGGMGEVFLAEDTRLHRHVALKALTRSAGPEASRLIVREARAAARLNHPAIAAIHDVVEQDGSTFIVMEYVDGTPLSTEIARAPVSIERAIRIATDLADALGYAHDRGVLHRDVKPANVIVTPEGRAKLLDLGVARVEAVEPGELTTTATAVPNAGTPAYMAPERLRGADAGTRADIYSLGVVLFELLTGRRPYEGRDVVALAVAIGADPAPDIRRERRDVPPALADLIERAMSRRPEDRPASGAAMADELRAIQTSLQSAHTVPIERKARRHGRAVAALFASALVVLIGTAAVWMSLGNRATVRPGRGPIAVLPAVNLTTDPAVEQIGVGLTALLAGNLASVPGLTVVSPAAASAFRGPARDLSKAARELGAAYLVDLDLQRAAHNLLVQGRLVHAGSPEPLWTKSFEGDPVTVERHLLAGLAGALDDAGVFPAALSPADRDRLLSLPTSDSAALVAYSRGRALLDVGSRASQDDAVLALEQAVASDSRFALAHAALSEAYAAKYIATKESAWVDRAGEAAARALALSPRSGPVHTALARIYNTMGRVEDAQRHAQIATELAPDSDDAHRLLGRVRVARGDIDGARESLERAIALRSEYWGNHYELGYTLARAGRYRDAIRSFSRVTELRPDYAAGYQALGTAYHSAGDVTNAIGHYEHALRLEQSAPAYANLGFAYYSASRPANARDMYLKAAALDPSSAAIERSLGDVYARLGEPRESREAYARAIVAAERLLKVNPRDARTIALVALCEAKLGRIDVALRRAAEARTLAPADNDVMFKAAVVYTLAGRSDEALAALRRAVALGFPAELARRDEDLKRLRQRSDFAAALVPPKT